MISIKTLVFNPFAENTFILYDETKECAIIDPGCSTRAEERLLSETITKLGLKPVLLLNTHCHIDHVLGNFYVNKEYHVPLHIPLNDKATLAAVPQYASQYGFPEYKHLEASHYLEDNQVLTLGKSKLNVVLVPGHTQGHVAFVNVDERICIGGDVLFSGSIGRTDLPGGSFDVLIRSIKDRLFSLPADTVVYPGHGDTTTIANEKASNPYCAQP